MFNFLKSGRSKSPSTQNYFELKKLLSKKEIADSLLFNISSGMNFAAPDNAFEVNRAVHLVNYLTGLTGIGAFELVTAIHKRQHEKQILKLIEKCTGLDELSVADEGWIDTLIQWANSNNLSQLQDFDALSYRQTGFPRNPLKLKNLQYLHLPDAGISELPLELGKLSKLIAICFDGNEIDTIPSEMCAYSNLLRLDLDDNKISKLPEEIGNLGALQILSLKNNQITNLPIGMVKLRSLTRLDLSGQKIHLSSKYSPLSKDGFTVLAHFSEKDVLDMESVSTWLESTDASALVLTDNSVEVSPIELAKVKSLENVYVQSCSIDSNSTHSPRVSKLETSECVQDVGDSLPRIEYDQFKVIKIKDGVLAWVDKDTELMWEIKNFDNIKMMYVWHTSYLEDLPTTDLDGEELPYETEVRDATSYVERLNESKYAGFSDWRLPTLSELESLIDRAGAFRLIKRPLQENTCAAYWTDTPTMVVNAYQALGHDIKDTAYIPAIKIVNFTNAETADYKPENSLWVRCVRVIANSDLALGARVNESTSESHSKKSNLQDSSNLSRTEYGGCIDNDSKLYSCDACGHEWGLLGKTIPEPKDCPNCGSPDGLVFHDYDVPF